MNGSGVATVFDAVWRVSLEASPILICALIVQLLPVKWVAARWRYWVGIIALARLLVFVTPESDFSVQNFVPSAREAGVPSVIAPSDVSTTLESPVVGGRSVGAKQNLRMLLASIWVTGLIVFLSVAIVRTLRVHALIRGAQTLDGSEIAALVNTARVAMGVRRKVKVVIAPPDWMPALFGVKAAAILWPKGLEERISPEDVRRIIAHELSHLKRYDLAMNWAVFLIRTVHWFNPLVWMVCRQMRSAQEYMCDESVIHACEQSERVAYGRTLLKLAEHTPPSASPALAPILGKQTETQRRIRMLLSYRKIGWVQAAVGVGALAVVSVATFTRAATEKPIAAETEKLEASPKASEPSEEKESIELLQVEIEKLMEQRRDLDSRWNRLAREIGGPDAPAMQHIENQRIATIAKRVEAEATRGILLPLIEAGRAEEVQNAYPEARLADLLLSIEQNEVALKTRTTDFGEKHPEVVRLQVAMDVIRKQLATRLAGVKNGLDVRIDTYRQVEERLAVLLDEMKQRATHEATNREMFDHERKMLDQRLNLLRIRQEAFVKGDNRVRQ